MNASFIYGAGGSGGVINGVSLNGVGELYLYGYSQEWWVIHIQRYNELHGTDWAIQDVVSSAFCRTILDFWHANSNLDDLLC
jgi:hypothetical protein